MAGPCVKCMSRDTELYRAGDGHFRKECGSCGHVGGPYTSSQTGGGAPAGQTGLGDFS